ncbi:hypothetical protein PROSTU_00666 [Providencia stuartii ATCC 25827]|uniref:Uncharacterized protein n=1 Tax=Providencia stuartii ATCC 25827 TaxID=471874 RepID=A0AA87CW27_PROST|nr:hypothetical protein PROSTU_00666 [Providencia stuartii ATCC 25827]
MAACGNKIDPGKKVWINSLFLKTNLTCYQRWNMKTFAAVNTTTDMEANNEPSL